MVETSLFDIYNHVSLLFVNIAEIRLSVNFHT